MSKWIHRILSLGLLVVCIVLAARSHPSHHPVERQFLVLGFRYWHNVTAWLVAAYVMASLWFNEFIEEHVAVPQPRFLIQPYNRFFAWLILLGMLASHLAL